MAAPKLRHFTVEGRGEFPLDMLRYDQCWPKSETDSTMLHHAQAGAGLSFATLSTYSTNAPTEARWRSFGWKVVV